MASLRERNGWFQILFRYQGKQFTHALKTQVLREAEAMRGTMDRVLIRIKNQEVPPVPEGVDVADYLLNGGKVPEPPAPVEKPLSLKAWPSATGQLTRTGPSSQTAWPRPACT
jgi:hypothetical protein